MLLLGQFFWSLLSIWLTAAAVASEGFITPPGPGESPDPTYRFGTALLITWQTKLERIALTLFHGTATGSDFEYLPYTRNMTNTNNYSWAVGRVLKPESYPSTLEIETDTVDKVFHLAIFDPGNGSSTFISHSFRIWNQDDDAPSSSTSSSRSVSSTSMSAVINTTSTSSAPSTTTSTQSSNPASSTAIAVITTTNAGLGESAKTEIGVGIGVGIGGPVLLAVGIYLGWKCRGRHIPPNPSYDDTLLNLRASNFQLALQELSRPRVVNNPPYSYQPRPEFPQLRPYD